MTGAVDPTALGRMLSETLAALQTFQGGSDDAAAPDPPEGTGSAADGMISVRAVLPGQLSAIDLNPRVLRLPSEQLAEELISAVNQALADLRERAGATGAVGASGSEADLGALGDRLREIQENTSRQMSAFTDSLVEAQAMIVRRAGGER